MIYLQSLASINLDDAQALEAHTYGLRGQDFSLLAVASPLNASENWTATATIHTNDDEFSYMLYRFINTNPYNSTYRPSASTVNASTKCNAYSVTGYENASDKAQKLPGILYYYDDNESLYVPEQSAHSVTYISIYNDTEICGPRCARGYAFSAGPDTDSTEQRTSIAHDIIYECNSTITSITNLTSDDANYTLSDYSAFLIAGAIGWSGYNDLSNIPG
jgi:hypothetical protein